MVHQRRLIAIRNELLERGKLIMIRKKGKLFYLLLFFTTIISLVCIDIVPVDAAYYHDGINNQNFTISNNKWFYVKNYEEKDHNSLSYDDLDLDADDGWWGYNTTPYKNQYFKFKAKYTGWMDVQVEMETFEFGNGEITVALLDSRRKRVSYVYDFEEDLPNYTLTFGVKKGSTYYIRVGEVNDLPDNYKIKVENRSYNDSYGKTKKKAKRIKRNKTKFGTFIAGSKNRVKWYKIKLTTAQRINFNFNKFYANEYDSKYGIVGKFYNSNGKNISNSINKGKILPRGTYYLKVYVKGTYCSGVFDFKWK